MARQPGKLPGFGVKKKLFCMGAESRRNYGTQRGKLNRFGIFESEAFCMVMREENGVLLWMGMIGHSILRYWCCWSSVVLSVLDVGVSGDRGLW